MPNQPMSRRGFLGQMALASAAAAVLQAPEFLRDAKAIVFQVMDSIDAFKVLSGVLPAFVAFFAYAEAGVFDPATRSLTGTPLGWTLSNYQGVSDRRDEFRGYLRKDA